jgi:hypothetical protein
LSDQHLIGFTDAISWFSKMKFERPSGSMFGSILEKRLWFFESVCFKTTLDIRLWIATYICMAADYTHVCHNITIRPLLGYFFFLDGSLLTLSPIFGCFVLFIDTRDGVQACWHGVGL